MNLWLVELKEYNERGRSEFTSIRANTEQEAYEIAREAYGSEVRIGAIAKVVRNENGDKP